MKRTISAALILTLLGVLIAAPEAGAGLLDKWKNKDVAPKGTPRYDLFPTMTYHTGVLGQGVAASWKLDDAELLVRSDCLITSDFGGDKAELSAGKEALVTGVRFGSTIVAYSVRIMKPDYLNAGAEKSSEVVPSEEDPTVGHGSGPQ